VLRKARAPERNYRCSYPRPPSWHRQARSRGTGCAFLYFFPFVKFLGRVYFFSWDRPGRRAKGSLQQAATARTADRKTGQNVRRHDLHRSNASMIKQKKYPSIHGIGRRGVGGGSRVSFVLSFVNFFGRIYFLWEQAGRRAKGSLQRAATARTADRKTG